MAWYDVPTVLTCTHCGNRQGKNEATVVHTCAACGQMFREPVPAEYQQNAEPIYAIGGLNRGDGAEIPMPAPKSGYICPQCGQAESDGAMFTTIGTVCDDCA